MEVSRKRPHVDEDDSTAAKKRVLTGPNGSPQVNGTSNDSEDVNSANLELFRKEAIYRRMKHYSRENERCQSRIEELEKRKQSCELGLAAMSACWNQLVKAIRILVKTDDLPQFAEEMFDFAVHIQEDNTPEFSKTLEGNMEVTQKLVTRLVEAGGNSQVQLSVLEDHRKETSKLLSLESQLNLARVQLRDTEELKERYLNDLQLAENRLERSKSKSVVALHSHTPEQRSLGVEDVKEESQRKPSSPAGSKSPALVNGTSNWATEVDILRAQVAAQEAKINELEQDVSTAKQENVLLEIELKQLSYERLVETPHYKNLQEHAGNLQAAVTEKSNRVTRLTEEVSNLQGSRREWEEGILAAANQANQELKSMLSKRDAENSRLRDQREQHTSELLERKQLDSVKLASYREIKALNESRLERISALESQLARTKARLAADTGDEDLMRFFLEGQTEEASYFQSLKERAAAAEKRISVLEQSLSNCNTSHPDMAEHIKGEADAVQKLAEVQAQLDKYKAVYGDSSALPADASKLAQQLQLKEEEVRKLRLQQVQHSQTESSLYAEIDKLSAAWESLDRQVKDKVFDLTNLENQLKKVTSEKAKTENKFYAAMRDKDATSAEYQKLQRGCEKQTKAIERLVDSERNLSGQLSSLEKELALFKACRSALEDKVQALTVSVALWSNRHEAEKQRVDEIQNAFQEMEKKTIAKRGEMNRIEQGLLRTKKELETKAKHQESLTQDHGSGDGLLLSVVPV
ncbi:hypothetical protein H0H92_008324 [Tricholoma furcatifolium]|nr:hypothetical protein H0H92_008324 [Tricholoma furcatifolium]